MTGPWFGRMERTQFRHSVGDWFTVPTQCRKRLSMAWGCQNDNCKLGERLVDDGASVSNWLCAVSYNFI